LLAVVAFTAVCGCLSAQDWPQWRGPNRDGRLASFAEPKAWPQQLQREWQVRVGAGHSSPVVVKDRVWVFSRQDELEVVSCLALDSGRRIWRDAYPAPYTMNPAATSHGKGPKSTPVYDAGSLFTLGISGILSCYDAGTGKLRWRRESSGQFRHTAPLYGTATSPVVDRGLLIAHLGGEGAGALTAFRVESGEPVWSWNGDGPGYASPIIVEIAGTRQIVTQSQNNIVGVSVADGRLLWKIPFTTPWDQNIVTPILFRDTLIFSGLQQGVMAVKVAREGSGWKTEKMWDNSAGFYMNTPVVNGNVLYGLSHRNKGQIVALDASTGKTIWTTDGRAGENAAIVAGADRLFILTSEAVLIVAKAGGGFEPIRSYTVAQSPTWAHPVVTGRKILVKDAENLAAWSFE
jgi:outer membrane protein assembly factor BamB